jgi:hypothetical protein
VEQRAATANVADSKDGFNFIIASPIFSFWLSLTESHGVALATLRATCTEAMQVICQTENAGILGKSKGEVRRNCSEEEGGAQELRAGRCFCFTE